MKGRWFPCDEVLERFGVERCCIVSEGEMEMMQQPEEGDVRCAKHGALLGTQEPVYGYTYEDARRKLGSM